MGLQKRTYRNMLPISALTMNSNLTIYTSTPYNVKYFRTLVLSFGSLLPFLSLKSAQSLLFESRIGNFGGVAMGIRILYRTVPLDDQGAEIGWNIAVNLIQNISAYDSRANGIVERQHCTIWESIIKACEGNVR